MRQLFIAILLSIPLLSASAQDVTLTKGETVAWLEKKINEIIEYSSFADGTPKVKEASVKYINGILEISYTQDYGKYDYYKETFKFNPLYIVSIYDYGSFPSGSINKVKIKMPAKAIIREVVTRGDHKKLLSEEEDFYFPFLAADTTGAIKIRKALLHLQSLLKAEDDPFGN